MVMGDIEEKLGKEAGEIKVFYVTTAGNLIPKAEWAYIDEAREMMRKHGWQVFDYDIVGKTEEEVEQAIKDKDVVFIQGGQCIYLLEQMQKCNFAEIVKRAVLRDMPYIGESTGSIITGGDVSAYRYWARDRRGNPPELENYQGIGLVDFLLRPHWGNAEKKSRYLESMRENLEKIYEIRQPIIFLHDDQVVRVEGDKFWIWEEGE